VALYKGTWTLSVIHVGQYWESVKCLKLGIGEVFKDEYCDVSQNWKVVNW
jgi:hypothetical protein